MDDHGSIEDLLRRRKLELDDELLRLTERPADPVGALGFGKRIGDGTTEAVDRINTTAAARSLTASIGAMVRALAKLDEGTYGRCDRCGAAIASERMEAIPWAALCVRCSAGRPRTRNEGRTR
jgi:DnaK suppressor protein